MIISGLLKRRTGRGIPCSTTRSLPGSKARWRLYSENGTQKPRSGHAQWYSDIVPAMVPIFLLGSAVFLGLQLTQHKLAHERYVEEASARVRALEAEVDALHEKRASQSISINPASTPVDTKKSRWW